MLRGHARLLHPSAINIPKPDSFVEIVCRWVGAAACVETNICLYLFESHSLLVLRSLYNHNIEIIFGSSFSIVAKNCV